MENFRLEVVATSLESLESAIEGGADRIELCSNLFCGGTTPSAGLIQAAISESSVPVHVLIRPRPGDFCYNKAEMNLICRDIEFAKQSGAAGIVCGFLLPDGNIDKEITELIAELASPLSVTFHRAFDVSRDPFQALEDIIEAGCQRLLTSGQKNTAIEGRDLISQLVKHAGDRIIIMPGSGVNADNIQQLKETGAHEFHMSGSVNRDSASKYYNDIVLLSDNPVRDSVIQMTSKEKVAAVKQFL
ncbi:MAG TPA: copper homeostasis protein CutC [Bacteroidales bacterium]|nr:copper homeostasis protein CutC [Bacteroidales bacterium]